MFAHFLLPLIPSPPPILPTDPRIVTVGRFDRTDPNTIACQWPASEIRLRVKGATLGISAEDTGKNFWQVVVDGKPTQVLPLKAGTNDYEVSLGGDGVHEVSLVKRTEAFVGTTRFRGFEIPSGGLFMAKKRNRVIEFVGDSITCGYGNEGGSQNEHFLPETENAYQSYASIAARAVGADVRLIAWSGRKMWPDNTMPEIYDRVLPTEAAPLVDPKDPVADVVVVNLATNDFGAKNPEEGPWTAAYETFLRKIRGQYPKAQLYVTLGSMMTDEYPPQNRALSTARGYLNRMVERMHDPKLHFVEFDRQRMEDGIGSDWHPNVTTDRKMADRLIGAWQKDLGWKGKLEDAAPKQLSIKAILPVMLILQSPFWQSAPVGTSSGGKPILRKAVSPRGPARSGAPQVVAFRPATAPQRWVRRPGRSPSTARASTRAPHHAPRASHPSSHWAKRRPVSSKPKPSRRRGR